ncbi:hypothetical protein Pyn_28237 [Prunus yedoensis var. nudiflora]|uniref:Uncharacterized protein n=1 Tax=Prunus yedoensis var. nudiflora TaxID=2094558 RepID=A0A314YY41_PRUYE|nr:hypothetical protein Pyn_28237 [Prunus yedoensis var. nudiflora]
MSRNGDDALGNSLVTFTNENNNKLQIISSCLQINFRAWHERHVAWEQNYHGFSTLERESCGFLRRAEVLMEGKRGSKEVWWRALGIFAVSGSLTVTLSKLKQSAKVGEMGEMGKQSTKFFGFVSEREKACSLKVWVVLCWVEEALL